jgi:hypothetical protein
MSTPLHVNPKERYDPRIGDEDVPTPSRQLGPPDNDRAQSPPIPPCASVRPSPEQESNFGCRKGKANATGGNPFQRATSSRFGMPGYLRWIPDNWTISKWMPAIRCAVAEWTSLVLLVVNPSLKAMGQAAFLVLVGRRSFYP